MKRIHFLVAGAVAFLAFGAVALAQVIVVTPVASVSPTDLIQIIHNGQFGAGNQYVNAAQITSQSGYVKVSGTSNFTKTFGNSQSFLVVNNATAVSLATVTMAPAPSDGAQECIAANADISALVLLANTGQTVNNKATSITGPGHVCYLYSASDLTWDRSN